MSNSNKLGIFLLWVTLLVLVTLPAYISKQAGFYALTGVYLFCTWIVIVMSLIFKEEK